MLHQKIIEEVKLIQKALMHNRELDKIHSEVQGARVSSVLISIGILLMTGLLLALVLLIFSLASDSVASLFKDGKNNASLNAIFGYSFLISSIFSVCYFIKAKKDLKIEIKNLINKKNKILEEFEDFNPVREKEFIDEFDNYVRQKINNFENDIEKVDIALQAVKDDIEEFSPYVKTIMSITEKVTAERAQKIQYRVEASRRLCEPEEEQDRLLKIVEN